MRIQSLYFEKQYEIMNSALENSRKIRHDLKNHWMVVYSKIQDGQEEDALKYVSGLIDSTFGDGGFVHCACPEINCILNFKLLEARNRGIQIEYGVEIGEAVKLGAADLVVVLGNLLDNAMEGAEAANKPWMRVKISMRYGVLNICIENSYDGTLLPEYRTRKKDVQEHGIGLRSVKETVERLNGDLHIEHNEWKFIVMICLYA